MGWVFTGLMGVLGSFGFFVSCSFYSVV
nr:ATP synthase F0 subunit 8 [Rhabdopleura sp. NHMO H2136]